MHQYKANLNKYTIALRENKEFWASGKAYKKKNNNYVLYKTRKKYIVLCLKYMQREIVSVKQEEAIKGNHKKNRWEKKDGNIKID